MTETTKYTFKIDDFTPESMPFGRLVDYYSEIKKMLGLAESMHLVGVFESSHGSAFAIDRNHESTLIKRLIAIKEGTASQKSKRAHDTINAMLKEDGTSGVFSDAKSQNVIQFPGKRSDDAVQLRIRDAATFTGELYHIAGTKDDVKVRINTSAYGVVFCSTTRDIAKALRDFLFEEVKVSGRGMWTRSEVGAWDIDDFAITDFAPVQRESLRSAVNRIREMGVNWPDDPLGEIRDFEENGGQVH
ncbi:hypothetical protein [Roseovarius sp. M141]|uniref:hypothetical protein n=1 Tax=Roseovarius sp. M141 TaxID=2583806 RepID=UPI0020CE522D|nr:hypothetical protein [Roseovarius sp. M141]MCQ0093541.1 hypothetical protein [Roseovarius sp. M141]